MTAPAPIVFILSAFCHEQWCPVLQSRFAIPDIEPLRNLLGLEADDDPEFWNSYSLEPDEVARILLAFDVRFDPSHVRSSKLEITLYRPRTISSLPYLVHTGYELPLLLDGRKKLARMGETYPPMTYEGEERFDYWVERGILHREELLKPFDKPVKSYLGHRTVYYTPKGEEWRIPAMKLIWDAASKSGGWNEYFERLEGMLFGYEDWQNDWWIEAGKKRGGFSGIPLCCAVTAQGLAWLEAAAYRALPPCEKPTVTIISYDERKPDAMRSFLLEESDSVALVCFRVYYKNVRDLFSITQQAVRHDLPSDRIPDLNRLLRDGVVVVNRRDDY